MTTSDQVRDSLLDALAMQGDATPMSELEFLRRQDVRLARSMGFAAPRLRTTLDMRFYGGPVEIHDLPASTAGLVIARAADLIETASLKVRQFKGAAKVFISPVVAPGSTVITLFGEAVAQPEVEGSLEEPTIAPTHLDLALGVVFESLQNVDAAEASASVRSLQLDRALGERIYQFAEELVRHDLSVDLRWTPASGQERSTQMARPRAEHIAAVLNRPSRNVTPITDVGVLQVISVDGLVRVAVENRRWRTVEMMVPLAELETMRSLWGTVVTVKYNRIITRHPQRSQDAVENQFVSMVSGRPTLDGQPTQLVIDTD
ncbi:MAG: hypothetical protein Q7V58_09385 [Actinomycetota bacterium]|nr:hypothetical protein [Actinomycetota bacterium]